MTGVLLFWGASTAAYPTRCFRHGIIYLEYQKHTFAGFGLCFAQIAEAALALEYTSSNEVDLPQNGHTPAMTEESA